MPVYVVAEWGSVHHYVRARHKDEAIWEVRQKLLAQNDPERKEVPLEATKIPPEKRLLYGNGKSWKVAELDAQHAKTGAFYLGCNE